MSHLLKGHTDELQHPKNQICRVQLEVKQALNFLSRGDNKNAAFHPDVNLALNENILSNSAKPPLLPYMRL